MENEIEKIIINLLEENDNDLFGGHKFVVENHIMRDQNNNAVDLSKVIWATMYENELVLYYSSKEKFLICYEGIEKFTML